MQLFYCGITDFFIIVGEFVIPFNRFFYCSFSLTNLAGDLSHLFIHLSSCSPGLDFVIVIKSRAEGAYRLTKEDGFKPSYQLALAFFREQLRFGHESSFFLDIGHQVFFVKFSLIASNPSSYIFSFH